MNNLHDLLVRYATADGYTVDEREWLMLLEVDPIRAATALTHLTILAAEDLAIGYATDALDAILAAGTRADAGLADSHTAAARIAAFTQRLTTARGTAANIWAETIVPLLRDADVLRPAAQPAVTPCPPRTWTTATVRLTETGRAYPAQIAARRHRAGRPIARFDAEACRRIAADTAGRPRPPLILIDHDRPILVLGAADLEHAWRLDARLIHADTDGYYHLGDGWPIILDQPDTDRASRHPRGLRHTPAQPGRTAAVRSPLYAA